MNRIAPAFTLAIVLLFFTFNFSFAQSYTLTSQADVDAFPTNCNCTSITGNLTISNQSSNQIRNLNALNNLSVIGGNLIIRGTNEMNSLMGLNNLESIGGDFTIHRNKELSNLQGLENLISIEGDFYISLNEKLTSLTGLESLISISGHFDFSANEILSSLEGLNNLTTIGGDFFPEGIDSFMGLENLTSIGGLFFPTFSEIASSLHGLENLTTIGELFLFSGNENIVSLHGLENLTSVPILWILDSPGLLSLEGLSSLSNTSSIDIQNNHKLLSLNGLDNVQSSTYLSVYNNPELISLEGLNNVNFIHGLLIRNNTKLSDCCAIQQLLESGNISGPIDISNNDTGCDSEAEIEEYCGLPYPWNNADLGGSVGMTEYDSESNSFSLTADQFSIGNQDNAQMAYQEICGNAEIYAHISQLNGLGYAGLMMRESLDAGAKKVALKTQLSNFARREVRQMTNGYTQSQQLFRPQTSWLKLVRNGATFQGFTSTNGSNWQFAFATAVPMNDCIYVGITAEGINGSATAIFDNVQIIGNQNAGLIQLEEYLNTATNRFTPDFKIAPNPAKDVATLNFEALQGQNFTLDLYNNLGQLMFQKTYKAANDIQETLDISNLESGLYLVNIRLEDGQQLSKKLIIEN